MSDRSEEYEQMTLRAIDLYGPDKVTRATAAVCSATLSAIAGYADRVATSHRNLGTLHSSDEGQMAVDVAAMGEMGAEQLKKFLRGEISMEDLLALCEGIMRFEPPYPRPES